MSEAGMRRFWDRRADEDAHYFVDSRIAYREGDVDAFWAGGAADLDAMLGAVGAELDEGETVVEIGCGVGRLTRAIAARVEHVVALDVSERMLERAREENRGLTNVRWVLGDGSSLAGVPDSSADACVSYVVFQHIPDPELTLAYVREMGRVLRDGGFAAFQVSNDPAVHRFRGGVRGRLRALAGRGPRGQGHPAWLGSAVELADVARAAAEGGMSIERSAHEGTQYCTVLARRVSGGQGSAAGAGDG